MAGSVMVTVKWGKKKLENVNVNLAGSPADFKAALYQLTGVPLDRQKIMAKGVWKGTLKDGMSLAGMTSKTKVTLIGTSAGIPQAPKEAVKFMEDMTQSEVAKAGCGLPPGFNNLGNTCYMNSTLQCLHAIPEFKDGLKSYVPTSSAPSAQLCSALKQLFEQMDRSTSEEAITPAMFVTKLRSCFPQFDERGPTGGHKQQDAEELLNVVLQRICRNELKTDSSESGGTADMSLVDSLFSISLEEELKCSETDAEPVKNKEEKVFKLICNIEGKANAAASGRKAEPVDHLHQGVFLSLDDQVELNSEILGRNAVWTSKKKIKKLPKYICFQFMRFFWKSVAAGVDVNTTAGGLKCKIMRQVKFPAKLDMYNFCSDKLKAILKVPRDAHRDKVMQEMEAKTEAAKEANKKEEAAAKQARQDAIRSGSTQSVPPVPPLTTEDVEPDQMEVDEDDAELQAALAMSIEKETGKVGEAGIGLPSTFQGFYEPFALVTHKGRSADGGHYIGWTRTDEKWDSGDHEKKKKKGAVDDKWICFDDADVEACPSSHVKNLNGGGDLDMAYLVFYRYLPAE